MTTDADPEGEVLDEEIRHEFNRVYNKIDGIRSEYTLDIKSMVAAQTETQGLIRENTNNLERLSRMQEKSIEQQNKLSMDVHDLILNNGRVAEEIEKVSGKATTACDKANELLRIHENRREETRAMAALEANKKKRIRGWVDRIGQSVLTAIVLGLLGFLGIAMWNYFKEEVQRPTHIDKEDQNDKKKIK